MARCENCIHENVCLHKANIQTDTYAYMGVNYNTEKCEHYKPTSDVVPKSEVEMLQGALKAEERHNELTMEMAQKALKNAKAEVAREIFEEIEEALSDNSRFPCAGEDFEPHYLVELKTDIAELKKKYQGGE